MSRSKGISTILFLIIAGIVIGGIAAYLNYSQIQNFLANVSKTIISTSGVFEFNDELKVLAPTRFLKTIFFGETNDYYVTPEGKASFASVTTDYLTVTRSETIAGLNADFLDGQDSSYYLSWNNFTDKPVILSSLDNVSNNEGNIDLVAAGGGITITGNDTTNTITFTVPPPPQGAGSGNDADTLDSLDSTQFLRSDTSDSFTSGTLTLTPGTTLAVEGSLSLPTGSITSTFIADGTIVGGDLASNIAISTSGNINTSGVYQRSGVSGTTTTVCGAGQFLGGLGTSGGIVTAAGTCQTPAGGSSAWSNLTDPIANLSLSMAAFTTTLTWNAATGTNNLFTFKDTTSNTGTGYLLNLETQTGSILKPLHISAAGVEALTILANGNVGIGTTGPSSQKLHVATSGGGTSGIRLERLTTGNFDVDLEARAGGVFGIKGGGDGSPDEWLTIASSAGFGTFPFLSIGTSESLVGGAVGVAVGVNAAATGTIRLPNATNIAWRNGANSADLLLKTDTNNAWIFGDTNVGDKFIFHNNGALALHANLNPSSTGALRLINNSAIKWRNAANTADVAGGIYVNTSDEYVIRDDGGGNPTLAVGSQYIRVGRDIGPVASSGVIRLPNNSEISFRNAANTGDVRLIGSDGANVVLVGPSASAAVEFRGIGTTGTAANAFLDSASGNRLLRSTSSLRYKNLIGDLSLPEAQNIILGAEPIVYTSKAQADDPNKQFVGFAAEQIASLDNRFTTFDDQGRPDWVQYQALTAPLALVSQDHEKRIAALENKEDEEVTVDGDGELATTTADGSAEKITTKTVEADAGIFQTLTATVEAIFEKLTAKTAEITKAVIGKLTVDTLDIRENVILRSASGSCFEVKASDTGELQSTPVVCP